ncbi:MAG: FAD-dependent oxidoreductase [Patescibacteria group bacterium]
MTPDNAQQNIVILGAGFGGIACAMRLAKLARKHPASFANYRLLLVDKNDYHVYTPALYEVATTASDDAAALSVKHITTTPLEEIFSNTPVTFIRNTVTSIDLIAKKVLCDDGASLPFAYMVFALGSEMAYFGIPGVKEHAISLKWLTDAIHIRATVRRMYDTKESGGTLSVVVGGGGPTGVEFSAELVGYIGELNRKLKKNVCPAITVVEGSSTILPGFDQWTVTHARRRLARLGVLLKEGSFVSQADGRTVFVRSAPNHPEEKLPYDIFIWSGGVQAVNMLANGKLSIEKRGRMETDPFMLCISPDEHLHVAQNIFAIGDNACFTDPETHRAPPATARLAIEQGKVAAENIWCDIHGTPQKPFRTWKYPYVIPLGGKYAVAEIGPFKLRGMLAWFFHELVELYYLISITADTWTALKRWWKGMEIFSKND